MSGFLTPSPDIETERLRLRGWRESDFETIAAIYADPDTAAYIGGVQDRRQSWRIFAAMLGHQSLRGYTFYAVERKDTGETIGWCGPWYPEGRPEPEIGYSLLKAHQGHGFALEAVTAAVRDSYDRLGWETAISAIAEDNAASQKIAKQAGATWNGETFSLMPGHTGQIWRHLSPAQFRERFNVAA
ncbi:GNAT family N-acetyltransferase [Notoacmeibacter ruber]|uniref:GNAT family N-acetyltransferase n=1 Tax=Notoacmeibacter ruber TaxID=2670375 RepID=UPI0018F29300|nr:GNAT family N-acetyltransferase [Notoacmeibacter ruber]